MALAALTLVLAVAVGAVLLRRPPAAGEAKPSPTVGAAAAFVAQSATPQPPDTADPATATPTSVLLTTTPTPTRPPTAPPLTPRLIVKLGPASGGSVAALDLDGNMTVLDWPHGAEVAGWNAVRGIPGPRPGDQHEFYQKVWVTRDGRQALAPLRQQFDESLFFFDLSTGARKHDHIQDANQSVAVVANPMGTQFVADLSSATGSHLLYIGDVATAEMVQIAEGSHESLPLPAVDWSSIAYVDVQGTTTFLVTMQGDGSGIRSLAVETPTQSPPLVYTNDGASVFYTLGNELHRQPMTGEAPDRTIFWDHALVEILGLYPEFDQVVVELKESAGAPTKDIVGMSLDGQAQHILVEDVILAGLRVSPDRKHRLLWAFTLDSRLILVIDPATASERHLVSTSHLPLGANESGLPVTWLADSRLLYQTLDENGSMVLQVESVDGSHAKQISLPLGIEPWFYYNILPDTIALAYQNENGSMFLADLDRDRVAPVARGFDGDEVWLAPGGRLVYRRGSELHVADMDGNDRILAQDVEAVLGSNLY